MKTLTLILLCSCLTFLILSSSVQSASLKKHQRNPVGLTKGKKSSKKSSKNPTDAFCKKFNAQCYRSAIEGKTETVKIVRACERKKGKHSSKYAFGCKTDGQDITQVVLNKIGGGGSTKVINGTVTEYTTNSLPTTVEVNSLITETSTSTESVTNVATDTSFATESLVITTAIPVTLTSTSTQTVITTIPVVSTVATSYVYTGTTLGGVSRIALMRVQLSPPSSDTQKRATTIDDSQFCSAFNAGCTQECARVKSTPKHVVCKSVAPLQFALTCDCMNKKVETQHALKAAADQQNIATVSTISTSTSYGTVTSTINAPTTVLSTSFATVTSVVPITKVLTTSTTVTSTVTAVSTSTQSTTVATTTPIVTQKNTATTTISVTATSTTQLVLPTIGALEATDLYSGISQGYVYPRYPQSNALYYVTVDRSEATQFIAVLDPNSGLYQLQLADGSNQAFISQAGIDGDDLSISGYTWTYSDSPTVCGAAGSKAGPPAGNGPHGLGSRCETFVFNSSTSTNTPSVGQTVSLLSNWVNPGQTVATEYYWILFGSSFLAQASTPLYAQTYYGTTSQAVNLQFPS